jgi:hypothetical protein
MKIIGNVSDNEFIVTMTRAELTRLMGFNSFYDTELRGKEDMLKPGWEMDVNMVYGKLLTAINCVTELTKAKHTLDKVSEEITDLLPAIMPTLEEDILPKNATIHRAIRV